MGTGYQSGMAIFLSLLFACGTAEPPDLPAAPPKTPATAVTPSPEALYMECWEAVEGPTEAGECTADVDCQAVGCSGEMCVTREVAASGIMSPCMERPCHAVLDTCGCVEGTCRWSLKAP